MPADRDHEDRLDEEDQRVAERLRRQRLIDTSLRDLDDLLEDRKRLRAENARLRAAGDALAAAVQGDPTEWSPDASQLLWAALIAWHAARGGGGEGGGPGAEVAQIGETPDEPTIRSAVRSYVLEHFLPGTDPAELTDATPLGPGGILHEGHVLRLVDWLAERFGVACGPDDWDAGRFDSVAEIAALVVGRLAAQSDAGGDDR